MKPDPRRDRQHENLLSPDDVQGAVRVLQSLQTALQGNRSNSVTPGSHDKLVRFAKCLRAMRRDRSRLFDPTLFGEPGWDILLALFIADREGVRVNVSTACQESGVPETTGLRWVNRLFELDLIRKRRHPTDLRVHYVELTPHAAVRMEELLGTSADQFGFQ